VKSVNRNYINYIFARKGLPVTTLLFALTFSVCLGIAPHAYASVEVGDGAEAGTFAVAVGDSASAATRAVAVGDGANAKSLAVAVGNNANAEGNNAVAVGNGANAEGNFAVAVGNGANAEGNFAVAVGNEASAEKEGAVAVGKEASAGEKSIAVGRNANAEMNNSVAVGDSASAEGLAVAIGNQAVASGAAAVAIGNEANAKETGAVAIGNHAGADIFAVAMGYQANAKGISAVAVGTVASANGVNSSAFGAGANAAGEMATAIGAGSRADGDGSFAAAGGQANEDNSIAIGDAEASSDKTIAIGSGALANDELAISIGSDSKAEGYRAVTMGSDAKAYGLASMALGGNAFADDGGIAIGHYSNAVENGVAIGDNSTANGVRAIGLGSWAEAHGYNSASFGAGAYATGDSALALGSGSRADGDGSFAAAGGQASQNSIAIGNSETTSENSIAIGFNSSAGESAVLNRGDISGYSSNMGASAIAIGDSANAQGTNSLAIGSYTYAAAEDSTALGNGAMANGWGSLALGSQASVNWCDDYAIAIGDSSAALATGGISIGKNAEIQGENSIALGSNAFVDWNSDSAIAIGEYAEVSNKDSVALGGHASADGEGSVAIGANTYASGEGAIALGKGAITSTPETRNDFAIALGHNAASFGEYSTAIGAFSQADSEGGVALGIGSYADREAGAVGFVPSTASTSQREAISATTSTEGAVSIGRAENGLLRQITDLAAGSEDTDAVNVAQLKASHELNQQQIRGLEGLVEAPITFSGDTGSTERKLGEELAVTGDGNVVVSASGAGLGLSLNKNIQLGDEGSLAVGTAVHSSHGYAIGSSMLADGALVVGSTLLDGDGLNMGGKKITSLTDGTEDTDAATVGQVNSAVADVAAGVQGDITNITNNINNLEQEHSTLANTPITFSGDTGSTERKLGEELAVTGDENIVTTADDEGLSLSLNKDIQLNGGSVTIGDTKMDSSGFTVGSHSFTAGGLIVGDINITESGINAGGNRITNVGEGTEDTDAATVGQVNNAVAGVTGGIQVDITNITEGLAGLEQEQLNLANTPIAFSGDTGSTERKLGEELAVTGDGNVVTVASNEGLSLSLSENINLGSNGTLSVGSQTVLSNEGLAVGENYFTKSGLLVGSIKVSDTGVDAGGTRITNLAEGVNASDAATMGQVSSALHDAVGDIQIDLSTITNSFGELENKHNELANTPITFSGDTGSTERKLGEELAVTGDENLSTVVTNDGLAVSLNKDIVLDNGSVTTGQATMDNSGFSIGAYSLANTGFLAGGISITESGIDAGGTRISNLAEGMADTDAATVGQVNDVVAGATSGIQVDITNITEGLAGLEQEHTALANTPITFSGNTGSTERKLGEELAVIGDGNVVTTASDEGLLVGLAENLDLGSNGSVTTGNAVMSSSGFVVGANSLTEAGLVVGSVNITDSGIDAGGTRISNLAEGTEASDAATVGQVQAIESSLNKGIGFAGDNGAEVNLKLGETMAITGGADADETTEGNIAVVADADKGSLEIKLAESVDLGANGSVTTGSTTVSNNGVSVGSNHFGNSGLFVGGITVDAGSNVIRGLSNTVLDPSNMVSGQAATEDQLRAIASILGIAYDGSGNTIEYNGNSYSSLSDVLNDLDWGAVGGSPGNGGGTSDGSWNVADEAGSTEITNGDTVTVAGDANIKVQQSAKENGTGSNVSIELAKDIEVESVTAKNIKAEEVKAESFVVEGGPSMNKDGIDAGGKRITNVARGVEASDAATVGQVNELRGSMDFEFKSMRRDMRILDHKTRAGIAAAMATASLPQAKRPGESIVSVGGGTWRGETGLAIGLSATSDNGKWTLNLSGNTTSRGDHGAAVGVGYQFR